MNWDDLRIVLAVSEAGSLTSGARGLGIDKATVSRRLSALEQMAGQRLFDRRRSGWVLTEAGQGYCRLAAGFSRELNGLGMDLAGQGAARARVRLTLPLWFCTDVLMPHLGLLRQRAPWLDLTIDSGSRVLSLGEREADVALRNLRPERGDYRLRKVGGLASAIYASRLFLARFPPVATRADLARLDFVGYDKVLTFCGGLAWLNRHPTGPVMRLADAKVLEVAVSRDLGAGVLPCILGDRNPDLVRVLPDRGVEPIWLVSPAELAETRAVQTVSNFVAEVFRLNGTALGGRTADQGSAHAAKAAS